MNLPNPQVVKRLAEHAGTAAAAVIVMLGLQAKGVDPAKITQLINQMGDLINTLVVIAGTVAAAYAAYKSAQSSTASGATQQAVQLIQSNPTGVAHALSAENKVGLAQAAATLAANSDTTKRALLDGVTGLPNVKRVVTDEKTAIETLNPNITSQ